MTRDLPPPRGAPYTIGLVCLGNICRSPMADVVLGARVADAGLDDRVVVDSCGTGGWHVGEAMDRRAAATLRAAGLDPSAHRAQQVDASWLGRDLLLAMDDDNLAALVRLAGSDGERVRLFRDFDPQGPGDVPDPYYGGDAGFAAVLAMVERTAAVIVDGLDRLLGGDPA